MLEVKLFSLLKVGVVIVFNCVFMVLLMCLCSIELGDIFILLMGEYYCQCVSFGLIIIEVMQIFVQVKGYVGVSGLYSLEQIVVWQKIIVGVYVENGYIVVQLWYIGCIFYSSLQSGGVVLVVFFVLSVGICILLCDENGYVICVDILMFCVLEIVEISGIVNDFCQVVGNVCDVGFDLVELYLVYGYLLY